MEAGYFAHPRTQIEQIMRSVDALIAAETQKLEALKTHKKA